MSDGLTSWLQSVDPRTIERERFNTSITKLRKERPGSKTDREQKRLFAEEAEMSKAREHRARWNAAVAANARRRERLENERRSREYKGYQAKRQEVPA